MRIFIDEDVGASLAKALMAVGIATEYATASKHSPIRTGDDDSIWLPYAGDRGMLVLSRNTSILLAEAERELVLAHNVGIVFLPQHSSRLDLLRLLMKKWDWLVQVDANSRRPFAYFITPAGRPLSLPISSAAARRLRNLARRPL